MKKLKQMILPVSLVIVLTFTIWNFFSCKKKCGDECCRCDNDSDCYDGMTCESFWGTYNGSGIAFTACAKSNTTSCH